MTLKPFLVAEREGIYLGEIKKKKSQNWVDGGQTKKDVENSLEIFREIIPASPLLPHF